MTIHRSGGGKRQGESDRIPGENGETNACEILNARTEVYASARDETNGRFLRAPNTNPNRLKNPDPRSIQLAHCWSMC